MPCCCKSDAGSSTRAARGKPPRGNRMKDRGNMTEDELAVDWWRKHKKSLDEQDNGKDTSADHNTSQPSKQQQQQNQFENSQSRLQQRNPLTKPYDIHREVPLRPQNGNVLQPSLESKTKLELDIVTSAPSLPPVNSMQVFQPELDAEAFISDRQPSGIYQTVQPKETIQMIGPVVDEIEEVATAIPQTKWKATGEKDSPLPQRDPSASFVEVGSLRIPQSSQGVPKTKEKHNMTTGVERVSRDENTDHLSDVPSDIDSVTKDRYLLACQMLKTSLIAKEKTLVPIEREFILSLLGDYEKEVDAGSVISEDQVSTIERAALRLDKDPIFRVLEVGDSDGAPPPSPLTAASRQMEELTRGALDMPDHLQNPPRMQDPPPRIAKRKKYLPSAPKMKNPCNPRSLEEAEGSADIILIVQEDPEEAMVTDDDDEGYDAESRGSDGDENQLVRFDGWNFHKQAEYPFLILGAGDSKAQPRVLTPSIMEAMRGFFPFNISESNFWLKFSLVREGASLATLLATVRASTYTIIGVETMHGEVFGSFTGAPWRTSTKWFGSGEAFLWRMKKLRMTSPQNAKQSNFENEMEIYPFTGYDDLVQYCTSKTIAVGGGDWLENPCPFRNEPRGIGFMIDGDLAGGETNSCATFANPRLCKNTSASNEFSISNLEVWTLTPCLTVVDAAKLEMKRLFVEENIR